jgi:Lamin Tail Domain
MKYSIFLVIFLSILSFKVYSQASQIIITEIFADPTPSKGLPEREYIEIYNNSGAEISLKGFSLSYGTTTIVFPDFIFEKNENVIVCKKDYESEFLKYGKVLAVSNLSLLNDGAVLILKNAKNEIEHIVNYSKDWYSPKLNEGIALEIIDLQKSCLGKQNWASSTAILGGTPGQINSVNGVLKELIGPEILNSEIVKNIVTLTMSQNIDQEQFKTISNVRFENSDIKITKNLSSINSSNIVKFEISTTLELQEKIAFKLLSPSNCNGNVSKDIDVVFYNLAKAKKGDLLISEVLFNPNKEQSEFFELYNASKKALNLKNYAISVKENDIVSLRILSTSDIIFKPESYMVFSKDKSVWQSQFFERKDVFFEMPSFPSLNNDKGLINLINPDSVIFDTFVFSDAFHSKSLISNIGVSLERINLKISATQSSNLHSSAQANGFVTPGISNSAFETIKTENVFTLNRKTIVINDPNLSKVSLKYALNDLGYQITIKVLNKDGKICRKLVSNFSIGIEGEFEWDGTDNMGQVLPVGFYFFDVELRKGDKNDNLKVPVIIGSY